MALFRISVEVPLLLTFFSFMLTGSVLTNLIIYRTCYLVLGFNISECALLGNTYNNVTEHLEKLVEPEAAIINMVRSTVDSIFTVFLCLFIGPWSDKFGRKPVLIINQIGLALSFLANSLFSFFPNVSPWYSIACSIPSMLTGGGAAYITLVLSYITDTTTKETRGFRMAVFEAVLATGILLGNISSSYVFYATSYTSVFAISAACIIIGILFIIFFIPESLEHRETEGKLREFFQTSHIVEMVKVSLKKREHYKRAIILLSIAILTIYIFIIDGDSGMMFLFLREKFSWTLTKFTLYTSFHNLVWILGTIAGTFFLHKLLMVEESVLTLLGLLTVLNSVLLQGLATNDWHIYASGVVRCLGGVISPMLRSLLSKLVPPEDIGKIFSLTIASEFIISMGASPLYTAVYNATIDTNPAIFNFLSAGLYTFNIILIMIIILMQNVGSSNYKQLENEEVPETYDTNHTIN